MRAPRLWTDSLVAVCRCRFTASLAGSRAGSPTFGSCLRESFRAGSSPIQASPPRRHPTKHRLLHRRPYSQHQSKVREHPSDRNSTALASRRSSCCCRQERRAQTRCRLSVSCESLYCHRTTTLDSPILPRPHVDFENGATHVPGYAAHQTARAWHQHFNIHNWRRGMLTR